jgi:DMSO/TMAO reductase YedYZ molybdopterin-dependent catalytic subunit
LAARGMVDDDPDDGFMHFNFNDDLAAQNYQVKVISGDENSATFDSAAIARNNEYIVANTLNGEPLPLQTDEGKDCWPLYLKGPAVSSGQQIGNIVRIELSGIPGLPVEWTLESLGDVGDTITREEFEEGLACGGSHYKEWTDQEGNVWSGMPLWVLLGAVDDDKTVGHWTFNDARAADGYTVKVVAKDGFSKTFNSADIARNDNYIVANKINGEPLTDKGPLRLVGAAVTKEDGSLGGSAVGNIVKIEIPELQTPPAEPGSWNLALMARSAMSFHRRSLRPPLTAAMRRNGPTVTATSGQVYLCGCWQAGWMIGSRINTILIRPRPAIPFWSKTETAIPRNLPARM